jgi:hypothetical protein
MIHDHRYYEMQSALAAVGQLTDTELKDLEHHATSCASCRECIADMAEMSREFFLMQATRMKSRGTPEGMQDRFIERAARAGISVSRSTSTLFDPRFVRVTLIAVVLAIATSLSWKVFSVPDLERKAAPESSSAGSLPAPAPEVPSHVDAERAIHGKAQLRRRSATQSSTRSISSNHGIGKEQSYFQLNRPLFAKEGSPLSFPDGNTFWPDRSASSPLVAGIYPPTSLRNAYLANCFGHGEDCKSEERAFYLDLKLASLSFLDFPQSVNAESHSTRPKFTAPVFHLDPTRVW